MNDFDRVKKVADRLHDEADVPYSEATKVACDWSKTYGLGVTEVGTDQANHINENMYKCASKFVKGLANYRASYKSPLCTYSISDPTVKTENSMRLQFEAHLTDEGYNLLIEDHRSKSYEKAKNFNKVVYLKKTRDNYSGNL